MIKYSFFSKILLLLISIAFGGLDLSAYEKIKLTQKEKFFIQNNPVITLGIGEEWEPHVIIKKNGHITGFDAEILYIINERTGAKFELYPTAWAKAQKLAKEGKIDGLSAGLAQERRKTYLNFSEPYIRIQQMVIVAKGNPHEINSKADVNGHTIGVYKGNVADELTAKEFKKSKIIVFDTQKELLAAVTTGKVDVCFGNATIMYNAAKEGNTGLQFACSLNKTISLVFGIRKDWPEAISILNKGLKSIPEHKMTHIKDKWFNVSFQRNYRYDLVWKILIGVAIVAILVLLWLRKLRRVNRNLQDAMTTAADAKKHLDLAFKTARMGSWDFAPDDEILILDEQLEELHGLEPGSFGGTLETWLKLLHPEDVESTVKKIKIALASLDEYIENHRVILKDGSIRHLTSKGKVFRNSQGKAIRVTGLTWDITELKESEFALSAAKELAEAATKAKSDFLANMSHEIRTPMNAILGLNYLQQQTNLNPKQLGYVRNIEYSAKSLLVIIDDILDLSKIEAGKLNIENSEFNLNEVFENLSIMMRAKAQNMDIEFIIAKSNDIPNLLIGDSHRLGQVLINLTGNAIKFTEKGEVKVTVEKVKLNKGTAILKFSVSDTGIGLSSEQKNKLFQSFQQADHSTTRKYGGTGLGLSISKKLVELMHGEIGVDSVHGEGSTFFFIIKFKISDKKEISQENKSEKVYAEESIRGARILLVEDNQINQQLAKEILESKGLSVEVADNGKLGVDMIAKNKEKYDLVLMDIQMPVMDGYAATEILRKNKKNHSLPIIGMTADAMEGVEDIAINSGMNDYITKPIDVKTMLETIAKWLKPQSIRSTEKKEMPTDMELPEISGIDTESGLKYATGNKKLYKKVLFEFADGNKNFKNKMLNALNKKDTELATRTAHSLKGESGSIGADELFAGIKELEKLLYTDITDMNTITQCLNKVDELLLPIIEKIDKYKNSRQESKSNP